MANKTPFFLTLTGILTGVPPGTAKPSGKYVYQKTAKGRGNIPGDKTRTYQVRRWVRGTQPNTPGQQPGRGKFALGVGHWHTLSDPEKETFRIPAEQLRLNRFQFFMREWMRSEPQIAATVWDSGTTVWDAGGTSWPWPEFDYWDGGATTWDGGNTVWEI